MMLKNIDDDDDGDKDYFLIYDDVRLKFRLSTYKYHVWYM